MDKRTLTLALGVLLLFLPLLSAAAAINYGLRADERNSVHSIDVEELARESQQRSYSFNIQKEWKYITIEAYIGYCCPDFKEGDAIQATITSPDGTTYIIHTEVGEECHYGDPNICDGGPDDYPEHPEGFNWIVLVDPPLGKYEVIVRPSGNLKEFERYQGAGIWVGAYDGLEHDAELRGNNIWWYYSDGSSEFVENGGYFSWSDATPRIAALGALSVAGWTTGIVLLVKARRLKKE